MAQKTVVRISRTVHEQPQTTNHEQDLTDHAAPLFVYTQPVAVDGLNVTSGAEPYQNTHKHKKRRDGHLNAKYGHSLNRWKKYPKRDERHENGQNRVKTGTALQQNVRKP